MTERPLQGAQTVLDLLGGYAFARLRRTLAAASCLSKGIVKFPIGEKSSVESDLGTVELKLPMTVEIGP